MTTNQKIVYDPQTQGYQHDPAQPDALSPDEAALFATLKDPDERKKPVVVRGEHVETLVASWLATDTKGWEMFGDRIEVDNFQRKGIKRIIAVCKMWWQQWKKLPPLTTLKAEIEGLPGLIGDDAKKALNQFSGEMPHDEDDYKVDERNREDVQNKFTSWQAEQAALIVSHTIANMSRAGKLDAAALGNLAKLIAAATTSLNPETQAGWGTFKHWSETLPEHKWLIKGWLSCREVAALYGPSGGCKSFIALDMALSISTGQQWAGNAVRPGKVAYVYSENLAGALKRIRAWKKIHSYSGELDNLILTPRTYNLGDEAAATTMIEDVRQNVGEDVSLIIVDTLAKNFAGDENSSDMAAAVRTVETVRQKLGCAIMLVHHTGKEIGRGERGHSSLRCGIDNSMFVSPVGEAIEGERDMRPIAIECQKAKDEGSPGRIVFARQIVELGVVHDEFTGASAITSLAMVPMDQDTFAASEAKVNEAKADAEAREVAGLIVGKMPMRDIILKGKDRGIGEKRIRRIVAVLSDNGKLDCPPCPAGGTPVYFVSMAGQIWLETADTEKRK